MKFDVDERADELALEIWNYLYRKTADLRPGYSEEFIRRMWLIAVTKVLAEIEELMRQYDLRRPAGQSLRSVRPIAETIHACRS